MAHRTNDLRAESRFRTRRSLSANLKDSFPEKTSVSKKENARTKTFLDNWVEPSLLTTSSYQDHGGVALGVLEHMQPLGEAPNAKLKARIKGESTRKSLTRRDWPAEDVDAHGTSEDTPGPAMHAGFSEKDMRTYIHVDDEKDDDYAPVERADGRGSKSRIVKRKSNIPIVLQTSPHEHDQRASFPVQQTASRRLSTIRLKQILDEARRQAQEQDRDDLANALQELWEAGKTNDRILDLIEVTAERSASTIEIREFDQHFKSAKRHAKKGRNNARHMTLPKPTLLTLRAPRRPVDAPDSSNTDRQRHPSDIVEDSKAGTIDNRANSELSDRPTPPPRPRISLKVKRPDESLNKRRDPAKVIVPASTPRNKRNNSIASDSSLTSLTSSGADDAVAEPEDPRNVHPKSFEAGSSTSQENHQQTRNLGLHARSKKRDSTKMESIEEDEASKLANKKRRFVAQVIRETPFETSSLRRSLRESTRSRETVGAASAPSSFDGGLVDSKPIAAIAQKTPDKRLKAESLDLESPLSELSVVSPNFRPAASWTAVPNLPAKRAKTKTSPEKKQTSSQAATSRPHEDGMEKISPVEGRFDESDNEDEELSENNDFCSACKGSGYLLCCDGCDRAFHFSCLDPPLHDEATELNEPWYCFICVAKRPSALDRPEVSFRGLFAPLLNALRKQNPTNFSLPANIRDYFEGVSTDKDGDFTETANVRPRNRIGYDDGPDYYRIKDARGSTIICHFCQRTASGRRPIITCDYCAEHWHLDCLDPPLSNPPALKQEGRKLHDWMCPLHVDHELRRIDTRLLTSRHTSRRIHLRKPRNARVTETALIRGIKNNGIIEVLQDESDASDSDFYDEETLDGSVVYRMPASGIKLDFIDKVKSTRVQRLRDHRAAGKTQATTTIPSPSPLEQANFSRRSFVEKQLALNLAQFSNSYQDIRLGGDGLENLLGTLIAEAPSDVVEEMMMAENAERIHSSSVAVPPSPPASDQPDMTFSRQRRELELLQELIRRRLESYKA